jgi:two-component system LytT family sensor kinase
MKMQRIYSGKILKPAIHILFWALVIIAPYLFRNPNNWIGFTNWHYRLMINNVFLAGLFYFNAYFLYPVIYKQKNSWLYVLTLIILVAGIMFLSRYIDSLLGLEPVRPVVARPAGIMHMHGHGMRGVGGRPRLNMAFRGLQRGWDTWYFTNILLYLCIIATSISYRIITDNTDREKSRKEKENETLKTELSFLRSQVSPHFIFNILNNLVSLARKKSDMLEPSLLELSGLMRYMLYENDDEKVSLSREVQYLKSYIALQLLRFGDDVTITFNPPDNIDDYYIEPLLLAPFVENAFKHGGDADNDPQINIMLSVNEATGWLDFKVMNSIEAQQQSKDKTSGIGLNNVRRRLELLYKDNYKLDIIQNDKVFIADLKIKLNA